MEVRIQKRMSLGLSNITIRLLANDSENLKIKKFGNPTVNVGGTFTDFTLPNSYKKVPIEFPYMQSFDGNDIGLNVAQARANIYADEMKTRIRNVMLQFKAIPDTFDDEEVTTV